MSVLDAVVNIRQLEQAKAQANVEAMLKTVGIMQEAKKTSLLADLEKQKITADLAGKGLAFNDNGQIVRDESLASPLDQLIEKGKAATAANAIYDAGGPRISLDGSSGAQADTSVQPGQPAGDLLATDFDAFGRPKAFKSKTAMGEEAKMAGEKARIEKQAKGVDEAYSGRIANYGDALSHQNELLDILYPKNEDGTYDTSKFNEGVKWGAKTGGKITLPFAHVDPEKHQRMSDLLEELKTAKRLTLTTRGVNESAAGKGELGKDVGIGLTTNPSALYKRLTSDYDTIKEAKGLIEGGKESGFKEGQTVTRNGFTYKRDANGIWHKQ